MRCAASTGSSTRFRSTRARRWCSLHDGTYQPVTVIGLDDTQPCREAGTCRRGTSTTSSPRTASSSVKDEEFPKLGNPTIGTEFELNDNRGVIVGIAKVPTGAFSAPRRSTRLTTGRFSTSRRCASPSRIILVEPKTARISRTSSKQVARLGYLALTNDEFQKANFDYLKYKTGIGTNTLLMTVISFLVGLSISGQTFYTFIIENLEHFGALKAMGAKGRELVYVIIFQAGFTALVGYGLGIGLSTLVS